MTQTKRKTRNALTAIMMTLAIVFAVAAALYALPAKTEKAEAATTVIDSLSLANINAGNAAGKYGNFSWDNTKIKSISASEMLTDRNNDPLCIVWTRPTNGAYASALTFSVNITDSVGAITIRYDDSVPSYISPGEKQSGTLTETVNSLSSAYEKIYFYISYSYMYNDVHLTNVTIQIKATTYQMTFTKGTGIKDAYLSTDNNAKSGSASGTEFAKFSTVYCFAKLAEGYKAQNGWTLIDGTANSEDAIYRVASRSNISATNNFGTINAVEKQSSVTLNRNGGTGGYTYVSATYGSDMPYANMPTREGYDFSGYYDDATAGTKYYNADGSSAKAWDKDAEDVILYAHWKTVIQGYGNSNNPYQISTADQLKRFRDIVNGINDESQNEYASAILMNDIDLENVEWTPIGTSSNKYGGTFDGKGYTIRGLYINSDSDDRIGFISYTGPSAKIKNLTLEGSVTATSNYANVGAFVGRMDGGLLTDCTNKATVNGVMYVGGLVGCVYYDSSNKAKVEKSVNQGAVTGTGSGAGGIAGNNYGIIENCYNTGTITGVDQVGGIIGLANYLTPTNFSTTSCNFNYGTISGSGSTVGNIIGSSYNNSTVESNYYLSATPNKGIGNLDEDNTKTQVLTADEFKDPDNFVGFDFLGVWKMGDDYPAFAQPYDLWLGNDLITESRLSGEGWSFDPSTNTLTFHDYVFEADGRLVPDEWNLNAALMYIGADPLTIILEGDNSIINTATNRNVSALYCKSPLTIEGTGSLYLTTTGDTTDTTALNARDSLTINGGTLVVKGGDALIEDGTASTCGINVHDNGFVINGGSVTVIGGNGWNYSSGINAFAYQTTVLTIGGNVELFTVIAGEAVGDNEYQHKASSIGISGGSISTEAFGTGWTNADGTEGETAIEAGEYDNTLFNDYLKVEFIGATMITIEIDDQEINYNEDAPEYTYVAKIDGTAVTDEDLLAAIAAKLTVGSAYQKGNDTGEYAITNSNASYNEKFTVADEDYMIGSVTAGALTVNKIDAVLTAPTAKTGLRYTGEAQELVNAGSTTGGTVEYKLNDGDWSEDIPTAINVDDDYIVYYRVVGGTNFNDIEGVALSEAIEIAENDKAALSLAIGLAEGLFDEIATDHPTVAAVLQDAIDDANAVFNNANKTEDEIASAVNALAEAIVNAQIGVVEELIDAIGEVDISKEDLILAAYEAFDELDREQQERVSNREVLYNAFIEYVEVVIEQIPTPVVYTPECGEKIAVARDRFDDLGATEQEQVENRQKLFDAEAAYKVFEDNAKADAVKALIEAIGTVEYTQDSKEKIDAAREAYDALTDDQKALVTNYSDLTDAEEAYGKLKTDNEAAEAVKALIEAIGTVEYTEESKQKIDAAMAAYNNLTDEQKALVANHTEIATAETTYDELGNQKKAQDVKNLIRAIGTVTYPDSKNTIEAARAGYDGLTDVQKELVDNYDVLVAAETTYDELGNQKKAQDVKTLISAIGTVKYPDSKDAIKAARDGYDGLTDVQKELVDNYDVLVAAETAYAELEANAGKKSPAGTIVGIVIGSIVIVGCLGFLLWLFLFKEKKEKRKNDNE